MKKASDFEPTDNSNVINKAYLEKKLLEINGHFSFLEKDYNEVELQINKQSLKDILIQRAVTTTVQILLDIDLLDKYANADKVLNVFFVYHKR